MSRVSSSSFFSIPNRIYFVQSGHSPIFFLSFTHSTPRIGTELHAQPVLLEDFFRAQRKSNADGGGEEEEDDHYGEFTARNNLDSFQRGNDFYRYQLRANFVDIAREDYQKSLDRSRGGENTDGSDVSRPALDVQLFTLERRIGVVSTATQNQQQTKLQQERARLRQRKLQQQQQQQQQHQDGYSSGAISPASGSSGWESNTSSTKLSGRSGKPHPKHHWLPFEGGGYHSGANKSVVDIAMNFTNFLGWTNYRTDNRITEGSTSAGGAFGGSSANEKYPTEPSTVKEVHRRPRELCAVAAAYEDVHTNPKFATSRFIILAACMSRSTETTTRTIPQFQHETISSTSSSAKGIAQKSKSKKKVVVVTSDLASFPVRQGQNERKYQQQQQNVRVVAPKIEVSNKETVETFLLVRSIGGYREMVLKPTTAALPWYSGEENAVTCIDIAPLGGRALVGTVSGKCYVVDLGTTLNPKFMRAMDEEKRKANDSDEDSETNRKNTYNLAKTPEAYKMKEAVRMLAEDSKMSNRNSTDQKGREQPAKARSVVWWRRAKDNKEIAICGDSTGVVRLWDIESGELLMTTPTKCNPLKKLQLVEAIDDRRVQEILKQQSQKYHDTEDSLTSNFPSAATGEENNAEKASSSSTFLLLSKRVARERDKRGNLNRDMDRVNSTRQKFRESRMSIDENYEENYENEYRKYDDEDDDMSDEFSTYEDVDTYFQTLDLETYSARIDEISCVPEQNVLFSGPEKIGSRFGHDGYETHERSMDSPNFQGGVLISRPENFTGHSTLEHGGKSFVVSSFADGRVDVYDAKVSDSKVIASIRTPNNSLPRFAYIVDAFTFFVTSSRSIAVISRATNTLVQKIVLPVEYGAIKGLARGIPVRSYKYELAIDMPVDIRTDDTNDEDDKGGINSESIGRNSIILEGVVCWTTTRVFEITPTASVFDLYEKLALSGRISRARELADALALDASEMALHACERALNARRGDTAAAMYYFAVRSDSDSPQKRYKMLARFCDACLRSWHVRATEHLLETMDTWDSGTNVFDSEPSSPAATFSRRGSRAGSRAGSLGGSPSYSGSKQQVLRSSNNKFAAEKSFRADARECLKRSRDRDIEIAVQTARIARANIIAWSSKEGVACLKACDELLDAEVSASASTTVVIIRDDGTEEEITREQFEVIENDTQFEPKLADSEFIKEFVDKLAQTCCADSPSSEQFDDGRGITDNESIPKWQRMENAIKAFEEGNHNAFKDEEDLSVADAFTTPTDSPMNNKIDRSSNYNKSSFSDGQKHLFEAKRANGRTRDRTNAPKTQCVSVHMRTVGSLVRALNVGSSEEDILFGKKDLGKDSSQSSNINESNNEGEKDKKAANIGEDFENQLKQNNIPRSLSIALPTLFWALGEEGRTNALSCNHSSRQVGPGGNTVGSNTPTSPSVSPRSSDQNSIEKSKTPFNTKKLFDIAHHNQKTSATFQKRIVNPELRVNCLLAHVAMEPANSERKVHYQRELEAEIKRAVIHSRNHKTEDDITSEGRVLLQIVGSAIAWSNDAALSTIAAQLGHFESANAFRVDIADRLLLRIDEAKYDERVIREDNKSGENDETLRLLTREIVLSKHAIERELKFTLEHLAPKCKDAKKRALCVKEIAKRWKNKHVKDVLTWDEFERMVLRTMPPEEGELTTFELLKMSYPALLSSSSSSNNREGEDGNVRLKYSANFALKCAIAPTLPSLGVGVSKNDLDR